MRSLVVILFIFAVHSLFAQEQGGFSVPPDTVDYDTYDSYPSDENAPKARIFAGRPGKAALFSLILPGAGQAYNKRYWKVPIVWAAVGGMGYVMHYNIQQYNDYKSRYEYSLENGSDPDGQYTSEQLRLLRNEADKNRQLSIFFFALVWVANSVEAYTDAHLMQFDISDDLSLELLPPSYDQYSGSTGIGVAIRF